MHVVRITQTQKGYMRPLQTWLIASPVHQETGSQQTVQSDSTWSKLTAILVHGAHRRQQPLTLVSDMEELENKQETNGKNPCHICGSQRIAQHAI